MATHTNMTMPDRYHYRNRDAEEIALLKFQLDRANRYIEYLEREFHNIPKAVEDFGYVEFKDERGEFVIRLIDAQSKPTEGGRGE